MPSVEQLAAMGEDLDLYPPEDEARYTPPQDPVSEAVGSVPHVTNFMPDGCRQEVGVGIWREPETFDRFYFEDERRLLVDILQGDTEPERVAQAREKHVEFKRAWCEENGYTYVVIPDPLLEQPAALRELIHAEPESKTAAKPRTRGKGNGRGKTSAKSRGRKGGSGKVQRPKAPA